MRHRFRWHSSRPTSLGVPIPATPCQFGFLAHGPEGPFPVLEYVFLRLHESSHCRCPTGGGCFLGPVFVSMRPWPNRPVFLSMRFDAISLCRTRAGRTSTCTVPDCYRDPSTRWHEIPSFRAWPEEGLPSARLALARPLPCLSGFIFSLLYANAYLRVWALWGIPGARCQVRETLLGSLTCGTKTLL